MRRVFIIRKDLHLKPGKLAAMVSHCAEAYFTNMLKGGIVKDNEFICLPAKQKYGNGEIGPFLYKHPDLCKMAMEAFKAGQDFFYAPKENPKQTVTITVEMPKDIWNKYVNGIFTKTICECRNRSQLLKAEVIAKELGLVEKIDYGYINDSCKTDLNPENEDGTCTVGIWFKPLPDDVAHKISKKFQLYKDEHIAV